MQRFSAPPVFLVAFCVLLVPASLALADRAAVEAVMREMETAVLAGDGEAYLKHVATDEPIFLKEQQNWAADLERYVPSKFALSIAEPPPEKPEESGDSKPAKPVREPVFDDAAGRAAFEMTMRWTIKVTDGGEDRTLNRTVTFPVVFQRTGQDGAARWVYRGEDWIIVESKPDPEHPDDAPNRSMCYPGFEETARAVVEVLPEIRRHVDEGFHVKVGHVQEVKMYASMRHLQASIYLSYWDTLSGWNEPDESIKMLASARAGKQSLRRLLAHEYGHVATFEMGPHANDMPWWVLEGVAELAAEKWSGGAGGIAALDRLLRGWASNNSLAEWSELSDFHSVRAEMMTHVYKQGQHMVGYVSEKWGRQGRNNWLVAMAKGATIDEATRQVLGMSFAELDKQWRADLAAQGADEIP